MISLSHEDLMLMWSLFWVIALYVCELYLLKDCGRNVGNLAHIYMLSSWQNETHINTYKLFNNFSHL
jgi:hypothetical protein